MGTYEQITPSLWDMSRGNEFSQLPDDDFLALLRKEYPEHKDDRHTTTNDRARRPIYGGADSQTLAPFTPLAGLSPPSDDSSPSPPDMNRDASSRGPSEMLPSPTDHDDYESALKRKASGGDFEDRPSPSKALHTCESIMSCARICDLYLP
jgi:AP-1-like transcription factor